MLSSQEIGMTSKLQHGRETAIAMEVTLFSIHAQLMHEKLPMSTNMSIRYGHDACG